MKSIGLFCLWLAAAGFGLVVAGCATGGSQNSTVTGSLPTHPGHPTAAGTTAQPTLVGSQETASAPSAATAPNHLELARQLIDLGHYHVALVQLDQIEGKAARGPECAYLRGICRLEMGDPDQAARIFAQILDREPGFAPACNGMGLTLARQNRFDAAASWFERAWALDPAKINAGSNLGYVLIRTRHMDRAETVLRRCLTLDPGFATARNNLALCLGLGGRDAEALVVLAAVYPTQVARQNLAAIQQFRRRQTVSDKAVSGPAVPGPAASAQDHEEMYNP